jgi:uncharacterized membrane protein
MRDPMRMRLATAVLALALGGAACGDSSSGIEEYPCPQGGTKLTYESFGKTFMADHCERCHGASVKERNGAPGNYVFDTHEQVIDHKDRIFARAAGDNDSMPPGPDDPPEAEREHLAEWLACDAP